MTIKQALFILGFFVCTFGMGQIQKSIPGFLGSRNAVSVEVMPNFALSEQMLQQFLSPAIGLTFERAMSRRGSLSISIGHSSGVLNEYAYMGFRESQYRNNSLYVYIADEPKKVFSLDGWMHYRNNYVTVAKSYYRLKSGSIAPQGKFLKLGLTYQIFKITKEDFDYTIDDGSYSKRKNPGKQYKSLNMASFMIEFGSKRFISKHLFFQKAFSLNIPGNLWTTSRGKTYYNIDDYNETNLAFFLSKSQIFNFSLAFGAAF